MSVPTICRSTRHFYLNYHHVESSSLYLHSVFMRRLQFALRLVATFLIGGFLGYATPLRNQLAQLYMIPNIGILAIQETFGSTFSNSLQITFIIVPLSIFLFIVQKIGLSYHNYVAGELLMLLASFYISYQCQKVTILLLFKFRDGNSLSLLAANAKNLSLVQRHLFRHNHQSRDGSINICFRTTGNVPSGHGCSAARFSSDFSSFCHF